MLRLRKNCESLLGGSADLSHSHKTELPSILKIVVCVAHESGPKHRLAVEVA
jgi:hypothetical protein